MRWQLIIISVSTSSGNLLTKFEVILGRNLLSGKEMYVEEEGIIADLKILDCKLAPENNGLSYRVNHQIDLSYFVGYQYDEYMKKNIFNRLHEYLTYIYLPLRPYREMSCIYSGSFTEIQL